MGLMAHVEINYCESAECAYNQTMRLCVREPIPGPTVLEAFHAQGVALKHSWRSGSGVRAADGVVVFAIMENDVQTDEGGSRCLLWSPEAGARLGPRAGEERLAHCRLAAWQISAAGILVPANAMVTSTETIELRVERIADQYWGFWGCATQARRVRDNASARTLAVSASM